MYFKIIYIMLNYYNYYNLILKSLYLLLNKLLNFMLLNINPLIII